MTDIEFKGKRKDNGEWVNGYYNKFEFLNEDIHVISFLGFDNGRDAYLKSDSFKCGGATMMHYLEVIPKTVSQFTGRKDKHDEYIFEGDKLRLFYQDRQSKVFEQMKKDGLDYIDIVVSFRMHSICITLETLQGEMSDEVYDSYMMIGQVNLFFEYISKFCEIIGNIHDDA